MGRITRANAARSLEQLIDDVADNTTRVTITDAGRPVVVLISIAELESMEERLFGLSQPGVHEGPTETETGRSVHRTVKDKIKTRLGLFNARRR